MAIAISLSDPSHFLTLNKIGYDWEDAWKAVRGFISRIRYKYPDFQCIYFFESHSESMLHAHLYSHGHIPDVNVLTKLVNKVGGRSIDVQSIISHDNLGYGMKDLEDPRTNAEYLSNNGGRKFHQTQGFFRDGNGGLPINGYEEAAARARERLSHRN